MSLLFSESPLIAGSVLALGGIGYYYDSKLVMGICVVVFMFLLYFYRYSGWDIRYNDNEIVSPCEGNITMIRDSYDHYYISIFLSPMNKHWQIYPANGKVIKRQYDHSGQFNMVMEVDKSKDNEKLIHYLKMNNGTVLKITQIAGFLPRMITCNNKTDVLAGEYLGMIKFGSRVELLINKQCQSMNRSPNKQGFKLFDWQIGDDISIGDMLGCYEI